MSEGNEKLIKLKRDCENILNTASRIDSRLMDQIDGYYTDFEARDISSRIEHILYTGPCPRCGNGLAFIELVLDGFRDENKLSVCLYAEPGPFTVIQHIRGLGFEEKYDDIPPFEWNLTANLATLKLFLMLCKVQDCLSEDLPAECGNVFISVESFMFYKDRLRSPMIKIDKSRVSSDKKKLLEKAVRTVEELQAYCLEEYCQAT